MTTTIERWVQDWYGLTLHTDRPDWRSYLSATGAMAAAHAAGFVAAMDITDDRVAAQLTSNGRGMIDPAVKVLAATRDLAWQCITVFAEEAQRFGFASLPTGPNAQWKPVCVREFEVGPKVYPALANDTDPDAPLRFTRKTAERISEDLAGQRGQRIRLIFTGPVLTVSHGGYSISPTEHEPDDDGLYAVGAGSLQWKQVDNRA